MRHEDTLIEVCGEDLALDDLRYLREEDLDQITATMSFVEARRLKAGVEHLKSIATSQDDAQSITRALARE